MLPTNPHKLLFLISIMTLSSWAKPGGIQGSDPTTPEPIPVASKAGSLDSEEGSVVGGSEEARPKGKADSNKNASTGIRTKIRTLTFELQSSKEHIAILEGEVDRKNAKLKTLKNEVDAGKAMLERLEKMLEIQRSLNNFQEGQIERLQKLLKAQRTKVAELRSLLGKNDEED